MGHFITGPNVKCDCLFVWCRPKGRHNARQDSRNTKLALYSFRGAASLGERYVVRQGRHYIKVCIVRSYKMSHSDAMLRNHNTQRTNS